MHRKTILSGEYNGITDHFAAKQLFAVSHIRAYLHEHRLCPKKISQFKPLNGYNFLSNKFFWINKKKNPQ